MKSLAAAALVLATGFAGAQLYSPPPMDPINSTRTITASNSEIRIDERLNAVVSPDIRLKDSEGKSWTTQELFSGRPTVLLLAFYKCTGVCLVELQNLKKTFKAIKKENIGELYNFVVVSIDPTEDSVIAETSRQDFLKAYNRPGAEHGVRFMVGTAENVDQLAREVGFKFRRDPANKQITHPAGIMVLSPSRRVCRYFINQEFSTKPVLLAIKDAATETVGSKDDRPFFLACVNVDPMTGQRSLNVMNTVKTGGILTAAILAYAIFRMSRSTK